MKKNKDNCVDVTLSLSITYKLNTTTQDKIKDTLENAIDHLVGEGFLTGETDAEVNEWAFLTSIKPLEN